MFTKITSIGALLAALIITAALSGSAQAQPAGEQAAAPDGTIRFSEPNGQGDQTAEGADYFTLQLSDPSDMSNPEDIVGPTGWRGIPAPATSGVWTGAASAADARVFLLHPGFASGVQSLDGHTGAAAPISSAAYSHLVVKYSASGRANAHVIWMAAGDPYATFGASCPLAVQSGDNIVDIDLNGCHDNSHPAWNSRATWGGIAFDPALNSPGVTIGIDWARLVPATGGPTFTARWACSNCAGQSFDIYADNDNNPNNGGRVLLVSGLNGSSTGANIPTGKLAPGNYYLAASGGNIPLTYSPGAFTVVGSPVLKFTAPSTTSGVDFATAVLGRPWNMTNANSIAGVMNIRNWSVANGVGQGTATNNDPYVLLLSGAASINTAQYHYLTFDLRLSRPTAAGSGDFNEARVLWYNNPAQANASGDIINWYDTWQHYDLDLRNIRMASSPTGWSGQPTVFRIDPHEEPLPPLFQLGPVKLTADPTATRGVVTSVSWATVRGGGTVDLFYAPVGSNNWTRFASNIAVSSGGYNWTVNVPGAGRYNLRATATNGPSSADWYTDVPLVVSGGTAPTPTRPVPTPTRAPGCLFSDVCPADYWYTPVQTLIRLGAISGYADNTFRPFNSTTRGQLSKIVVVAFGKPTNTSGGPHFRDVLTSNPFYSYIETAYNAGIISGYADGTFRWGNNVTRAQLSKIVVTAAGWPTNTSGGPHFRDVPRSNSFYNFIETAFNHGIISGYANGTFGPGNSATRGQIAKILALAVTSAAEAK